MFIFGVRGGAVWKDVLCWNASSEMQKRLVGRMSKYDIYYVSVK